jgi:hypothetical protein
MTDEQAPRAPQGQGRKPVIQHVPAILTGSAALIAALTTVYVNVRGDRQASAQPAAATAAPATIATIAAAPTPAAPAAAQRVRLAVERIAVEHDGSPGTTDWRFTVEADGEALFAFQQDGLDDQGGRNVANPADAAGVLRLSGKPVHVVVKGWRGSWFRMGSAPDATGEGVLSPSGAIPPLRVQAAKPQAGAFVFHLSATSEDASG